MRPQLRNRILALGLALALPACGWIVGEITQQLHRQKALDQQVYKQDVALVWKEVRDLWTSHGCEAPEQPKIGETIACEASEKRWLRVDARGGGHHVEIEVERTQKDAEGKEKNRPRARLGARVDAARATRAGHRRPGRERGQGQGRQGQEGHPRARGRGRAVEVGVGRGVLRGGWFRGLGFCGEGGFGGWGFAGRVVSGVGVLRGGWFRGLGFCGEAGFAGAWRLRSLTRPRRHCDSKAGAPLLGVASGIPSQQRPTPALRTGAFSRSVFPPTAAHLVVADGWCGRWAAGEVASATVGVAAGRRERWLRRRLGGARRRLEPITGRAWPPRRGPSRSGSSRSRRRRALAGSSRGSPYTRARCSRVASSTAVPSCARAASPIASARS